MFSLYNHLSFVAKRGRTTMFLTCHFSFVIRHVNLLIPNCHTDTNRYMALMNVTCDMSQIVVIVPVLGESSATLASYFI